MALGSTISLYKMSRLCFALFELGAPASGSESGDRLRVILDGGLFESIDGSLEYQKTLSVLLWWAEGYE